MKRTSKIIISLVLLIAIAIVPLIKLFAEPDNRTEITSATVSISNFNEPGYGVEVGKSGSYEIQVTAKNPTTAGRVYVFSGSWEFYDEAHDSWWMYSYDVFKEGKYRFSATLEVSDDESDRLSDDIAITVNGTEWGHDDPEYYGSQVEFYSPTYTVAKSQINEIKFLGESCATFPTIWAGNVLDETLRNGYDELCVIGGNENYTFSKVSGPTWVSVTADGNITGTATTVGPNSDLVIRVSDTANHSGQFSISLGETYPDPKDREKITSVSLTATYDDEFEESLVVGAEADEVSNLVTFESEDEKLDVGQIFWYKKEGNQWIDYLKEEYTEDDLTYSFYDYEKKFVAGTYRFGVKVGIGWTFETDYTDYYQFGDTVNVKVNGETWDYEFVEDIWGDKEVIAFSEEYEITDGGTVSPKVINSLNVTGVVAPVEDEHPDTSNIRITTKGVSLKSVVWTKESDGSELTSADTFVVKQRYILRLTFDLLEGYQIDGEPSLIVNANPLMSDYVGCPGDEACTTDLDVRLSYEALSKVPTAIEAKPHLDVRSENDTLIFNVSYDPNATRVDIYEATSKTGKYSIIGTLYGQSVLEYRPTYGVTLYYKAKACNEVGCSDFSEIVSAKLAPNKAEGLNALTVSTNQVKLGWDTEENVDGYELSRSTKLNGKYTVLMTKNADNYTNTRLSANTTYYYRVRAYVKKYGKKVYGPYSEVLEVKTAPIAPRIAASVTDYNAVKVTAYSVKGAAKYEIYRSLSKTTDFEKVGEIEAAGSYNPNTFTSVTTYYYKVRACNSKDYCGNYSSVLSKKPIPKTPTISLSVDSNKRVNVKITAVNGADGYEVYRSLYYGRRYALVGTTEELEYTDEVGLNTRYYYKVRAYRVVGEKKVYGNYSSYKYAKATISTPSITVSKNSFEEAKITITGVGGAAGYEIYRSTNRYRGFKVVKDTTDLENVDELKLNTTYYYKIRAYIVANGKKYYSKYSKLKSIKLTLGTPTVSTARSGLNKVNINLTEVLEAEGYEIYRSLYKNKRFVLISDSEELTYEDTVNMNTTYYYKARAYIVRDGKKYYSSYTTLKTVKLGLGVPTYTLEGQEGQIEVKINEVTYAEGYEIYRATSKYGRFTKVGETTETSYNDPAQANKTYYYKVRAYATVNEKRVYGGYSTIKSAKALALSLPE